MSGRISKATANAAALNTVVFIFHSCPLTLTHVLQGDNAVEEELPPLAFLAVQAETALPLELAASGQDTAQAALCQSDRARKTIWIVPEIPSEWYW
jgi:hypothetical protein